MKKGSVRALRFFNSSVFAFLISAGTVFCPITAFHLPAYYLSLFLFCLFSSVFAALIFQSKHAWLFVCILTCLFGVALYYFWNPIYQAFSAALETISSQYSIPFDSISTITLVADQEAGAPVTAYFYVICLILSILTAWVISDRLSLWIIAAASLPHLIICLIILETVPAWWSLLILSLAYFLMILTQDLRCHSGTAGDRLALQLFLPAVLLVALIALLVSPNDYQRSDWVSNAQSTFSKAVDHLSFLRYNEENGHVEFVSPFSPSTLGSRVWDSSVSRVNLEKVGPQVKTGLHVMQVYSDFSATFHLRADSLATYENNEWTALDSKLYQSASISPGVLMSNSTGVSSNLQIKTDMKASIFYIPYKPVSFPDQAELVGDAYVLNPDQVLDYTVPYVSGTPSADLNSNYETFVFQNYLEVPEETRNSLASIVSLFPISSYSSVEAQAAAVSNYVESSAAYSLDTPHVPDGEDFVVWFLTQCDTGYCVHYATSAAILLRCLGIPARYVTGYLVEAKGGQWTNVTEDNAHAWVEYYVKGEGWNVLDPTPPEPANPESTDSSHAEQASSSQIEKAGASASVSESTESAQSIGIAVSSNSSTAAASVKKQNLSWVVFLILFLVFFFGWRYIVLGLRHMVLNKGSYNHRALANFRHIHWLDRQLGRSDPEELHDIALKARFSQHKISKDELSQLIQYSDQATRELLSHPNRFKQICYRIIFGLG